MIPTTEKGKDGLTASVCVVIVDYATSLDVLTRTLNAVYHSTGVGNLSVVLVDNGSRADEFRDTLLKTFPAVRLLTGHGNVGFGAGNNVALQHIEEPFVLFVNPDAFVDAHSIAVGMEFLDNNPSVSLACPNVVNEKGEKEFLCRGYPTIRALLGRLFGVRFFQEANRKYLLLDRDWSIIRHDFEIASGCFMLCRTNDLKRIGGFDERYFLYFEDYDLSLRLVKLGRLAFLPTMRVTHLGGGVARKSLVHKRYFFRSAWLFFRLHGWKW